MVIVWSNSVGELENMLRQEMKTSHIAIETKKIRIACLLN